MKPICGNELIMHSAGMCLWSIFIFWAKATNLQEHSSDFASKLRLLAGDEREEALSKHLLLLLWVCCCQHGSCELPTFMAWDHC